MVLNIEENEVSLIQTHVRLVSELFSVRKFPRLDAPQNFKATLVSLKLCCDKVNLKSILRY